MQERRNFIANALELHFFCTYTSLLFVINCRIHLERSAGCSITAAYWRDCKHCAQFTAPKIAKTTKLMIGQIWTLRTIQITVDDVCVVVTVKSNYFQAVLFLQEIMFVMFFPEVFWRIVRKIELMQKHLIPVVMPWSRVSCINPLSPGRCGSNLKCTIFKHNLALCISGEIALRWMQLDLGDKSSLVQGKAWCLTPTSHYLNEF